MCDGSLIGVLEAVGTCGRQRDAFLAVRHCLRTARNRDDAECSILEAISVGMVGFEEEGGAYLLALMPFGVTKFQRGFERERAAAKAGR